MWKLHLFKDVQCAYIKNNKGQKIEPCGNYDILSISTKTHYTASQKFCIYIWVKKKTVFNNSFAYLNEKKVLTLIHFGLIYIFWWPTEISIISVTNNIIIKNSHLRNAFYKHLDVSTLWKLLNATLSFTIGNRRNLHIQYEYFVLNFDSRLFDGIWVFWQRSISVNKVK